MAAFADIILADGQATPVNHTFKVKTCVGTKARWEDRVTGIPLAYGVLSSETSESAAVRRIKMSIAIPTLEAVSGANPNGFTPAPAVAYTHRINVEFLLPQRGSQAERKSALAFVKNALLNSVLAGIITDGDEIAG